MIACQHQLSTETELVNMERIHMSEVQEVVKEEAVETPTVVESTPTEEVETPTPVEETTEKPAETQETPVVESDDTEKKVSENVPYERFSEKAAEAKELKERNAYLEAMQQEKAQKAQPAVDVPDLDEQSAMAVEKIVNQRLESRIEADFQRKHKEDLSDRLVKTAYESVIREKMDNKVPYIDRDESLKEARELIESRLKKETSNAKDAGVEEGQKLAEQKQQSVAVGEAGKTPKVDEKDMSPADYAKIHNLPRVN